MKGLQLRPTGYYFRLRVPAHLRATYGRREVVKALGTRDRDEAVTAAQTLLDRLQREFASLGSPRRSRAEIAAPRPLQGPPMASWTLGDMVEAFQADRRASSWGRSTARTAACHLAAGLAFFGPERSPAELTKAEIREWRSQLLCKGNAQSYVNAVLGTWGSLYRWAANEAEVPGVHSNPFAALRLKGDRAESEERLAFDADQLRLVFDGWPWGQGGGIAWVPLLMLYAGLRPREAAQLALDDVQESEPGNPVVHVRKRFSGQSLKTKGAEREVPLAEELWSGWGFGQWWKERMAAAAFQETTQGLFLFPELMAFPREPSYKVSAHFTKHLRALGFTDRRYVLYSLRHTLATFLGEIGVTEKLVGDLLGHRKKTLAGNRYMKRVGTSVLRDQVISKVTFGLPTR